MTEPRLEPTFRLSVIIPTSNRRGMAERACRSVLEQDDPIGTEVIVADDGSRDETVTYLSDVFRDEILKDRFRVMALDRTGDLAKARNLAAASSRGTYLAFLEDLHFWRPVRLRSLEPLLKGHDLIVATREPELDSSDWIRSFLSQNLLVESSIVVRRTHFEEVGGFPEGYGGLPLPKRIPGDESYEFALKCLVRLIDSGQKDRFILSPGDQIALERPPLPAPIEKIEEKVQSLREVVSLVKLTRTLPKRYWIEVAKRIGATSRGLFK